MKKFFKKSLTVIIVLASIDLMITYGFRFGINIFERPWLSILEIGAALLYAYFAYVYTMEYVEQK